MNADDDYFDYWQTLVTDVATLTFGLSEAADVSATDIESGADATSFSLQLPDASVAIRLPLAGIHNVRNACAAAAVAHALGTPLSAIKAGLESVEPVGGRLQPVAGLNGATLYDDSYNANPVSVTAAGEFIASLEGAGWMVLGDMGELGDDALAMHKDLGTALREAGIERLFAVGELSRATVNGFGDGGEWFASIDELNARVAGELYADVNVLVKGSRSARMERAVDALRAPEALRKEA